MQEQIDSLLARLQRGESIRGGETTAVDFKEEAGSSEHGRRIQVDTRSEKVANQVAKEIACMANTPGGGALLLGVSDDGEPVGTTQDAEWLRHRVFELTDRKVTAHIYPATVAAVRLLVIKAVESFEPVRWKGKVNWRVGTSCVEIDPSAWHQRRFESLDIDWSGLDSGVPEERVEPVAISIVRRWLSESLSPTAGELSECDQPTLLRRLGAVTGAGTLTNAACLLFVGRGVACLDYMRRDHDGGDSRIRVNVENVSLAEELKKVFDALEAHTFQHHVQHGPVFDKVAELPFRAAREAVVNGVAHRNWELREETIIEHVGSVLRVTSPGGFYGSVDEGNVLTHPSCSRNRALTQLLADVAIAEREGVGVDRMTIDMVRAGRKRPLITEVAGPRVSTVLLGGAVDAGWLLWITGMLPAELRNDAGILLILAHLVETGWVDAATVAPVLQRSEQEASEVIAQLAEATFDGSPVLSAVSSVPDGAAPAWVLSEAALANLNSCDERQPPPSGQPRVMPTRSSIAMGYAQARGRISSSELASLTHAAATNMGSVLKALSEEGRLTPSSPTGAGRGFHYKYSV